MRTEIKERRTMNGYPYYDLYVNGEYHRSYTDKLLASIDEKEIIEEKLKGVCI